METLIDCIYNISSTWTRFGIDLKNLKQILLKNPYPLSMMHNVIKKYLQNAINKTNTRNVFILTSFQRNAL